MNAYDPRPIHLPLDLLSQFSFASLFTPPRIHIVTTALTLILPVLLLWYVHHDYQCFLSLGPGGTPATPLGYLKIKSLSFVSLRDPLRPISIPPHFRPQKGYLSSLPRREGKRPVIQGIAPQRQQTQRSSAAVYKMLVAELKTLAKEPANMLLERTSCFEKHSSGLFASTPITRVCGGEICHAHPSDGSLHLSLHPADAKLLIENGWGERHPLAKGGWFRRFVPKEFVLVYAPRNEEEVAVVMKVVAASVWWVSGVHVGGGKREMRMEAIAEEVLAEASKENECWACRIHGCGKRGKDKLVGNA